MSRKDVASQSTSGQELSYQAMGHAKQPKKALGDDNYSLEMSSLGF